MTGETPYHPTLSKGESIPGEWNERTDARLGNKSPSAFKTISEVADELDVPQHVLRFWETKFKQIKPVKRSGGRRYYRPQDIVIISEIKHLLYQEGYTIKGARQVVEHSVRNGNMPSTHLPAEQIIDAAPATDTAVDPGQLDFGFDVEAKKPFPRKALHTILEELRGARELLKADA